MVQNISFSTLKANKHHNNTIYDLSIYAKQPNNDRQIGNDNESENE